MGTSAFMPNRALRSVLSQGKQANRTEVMGVEQARAAASGINHADSVQPRALSEQKGSSHAPRVCPD